VLVYGLLLIPADLTLTLRACWCRTSFLDAGPFARGCLGGCRLELACLKTMRFGLRRSLVAVLSTFTELAKELARLESTNCSALEVLMVCVLVSER